MAAYGFDEYKNKVLVAGADDFGDKTQGVIEFPNGKMIWTFASDTYFQNIPANGTVNASIDVGSDDAYGVNSVIVTPKHSVSSRKVIISAGLATRDDNGDTIRTIQLAASNLESSAVTSYGCFVTVVGYKK